MFVKEFLTLVCFPYIKNQSVIVIHVSWGYGWLKYARRIYWIVQRRYWHFWEDITQSKPGNLQMKIKASRLVSAYPKVEEWARHPWKAILGELSTCFGKSIYVPHLRERERDFWGFSLKLWVNYLTFLSLRVTSTAP